MSSQDVTNGLKAHMACWGWGQLFRPEPAYQRTLLLRDTAVTLLELRFLSSRNAYESFRQNNSPAYFALDKTCDELTVAERTIG
jgi:hypothetical protein